MSQLSCSVILPCYNPQPGWVAKVVSNYKDISNALDVPPQLILVNDGSSSGITDTDAEELRSAISNFRYVQYTTNKGKGYALRAGVKEADSDIIIYTDIDFPYNTDSLLKVYGQLEKGTDLAIGVKDDQYYAKVPAARRHISRALRSMIGLFFDLPVTDTQCGLKGFKKEVRPVFLNTEIDRYLFDLEFIRAAHKKGFKLTPVPVKLNDNVVFRHMNYKILFPEIVNFMSIILRRK